MTRAEIADLVNSYEPSEPVTVDDCRAIFADIKAQLVGGTPLDVVIRGLGSERDPGPKRIDVVVNAGRSDAQLYSIFVRA